LRGWKTFTSIRTGNKGNNPPTRPECRTGTQCRPLLDNDEKPDESHTMADAQTHAKNKNNKMNSAASGEVLVRAATKHRQSTQSKVRLDYHRRFYCLPVCAFHCDPHTHTHI
jgi:hypothetical protein